MQMGKGRGLRNVQSTDLVDHNSEGKKGKGKEINGIVRAEGKLNMMGWISSVT